MSFIKDDFLLENRYSEQLYFEHAKDMPIIDYHNHLPPEDIWEDRVFQNITEAWLEDDHYKWRAMRALGVKEHLITGDAGPFDKFKAWASSVPYTMRNPLYHWTHMELKSYFGIDELLHSDNAEKIYDDATELLKSPGYSATGLLEMKKVKVVCTTDDPADSLEYHIQYQNNPKASFQMFPTWRPDQVLTIEAGSYRPYIERLGAVENIEIRSLADLKEVMNLRMDFFNSLGCRASDYGLARIYSKKTTTGKAEAVFQKRLDGKEVTSEEADLFKSYLLDYLCRAYHDRGWVQQFHIGALRDNNRRMVSRLGQGKGYDSIGDFSHAQDMSRLFDSLDFDEQLTKTIIYNNNPSDNALFATMAGNYNEAPYKGKMQFGSGWWFLDQKRGMEDQMNVLSEMGLLSLFVGMLTDSRSFLSFSRHDYFRRILCNLLGKDIEFGMLPKSEMKFIGRIVEDICFYNANNFFKLHSDI